MRLFYYGIDGRAIDSVLPSSSSSHTIHGIIVVYGCCMCVTALATLICRRVHPNSVPTGAFLVSYSRRYIVAGYTTTTETTHYSQAKPTAKTTGNTSQTRKSSGCCACYMQAIQHIHGNTYHIRRVVAIVIVACVFGNQSCLFVIAAILLDHVLLLHVFSTLSYDKR